MTDCVPCPLCASFDTAAFHSDIRRDYLQCFVCELVFVRPQFFLSEADERAQYDLHENSPEDPRYRDFLSRLMQPVLEVVPPNGHGLDFGCGPGPTLSVMFEEAGHSMAVYDPFFEPDRSVLNDSYDFITASEVVEHLHSPGKILRQLWACLRPNGVLGIMTQPLPGRAAFPEWHYKTEPTHVCFFSDATWAWVAGWLDAELLQPRDDVALLRKLSPRADARGDIMSSVPD